MEHANEAARQLDISRQETMDLPCIVPCSAAWLVRGSTKERYSVFSGSELIVGRGETCDVRLDDLSVSRRHMRLRCGPGWYIVEDVGSRNGTFVEGVLLQPLEQARIEQLPARIRCGGEFLVLEEGGCPASGRPARCPRA